MPDGSLRAARDALMADRSLTGGDFCRALSDAADSWLQGVAERAAADSGRKMALLAVGGYGRRELCPFSDLDLLLVYEGRREIKDVADRLWYPVWDEGISVDHAVRRPKEVLRAASEDLRVALGLLDARVVWGDARIVEPIVTKVRQLWQTKLASEFLPALEAQMAQRHREQGDVAFLLEPNLKEAHGGLRDASVLRALATCSPRLDELVDLRTINDAASTLTAVRVELHRNAGRALDRMLLQEQNQAAETLGYIDADELCSAVSKAGHSIAWVSDEIWRRRPMWEPGAKPPSERSLERVGIEDGIVIANGEVGLAPAAEVATDCSLVWRVAAVGAEHDLPLSLAAVHRMADLTPEPPDPWSDQMRDSLVRLLLAGSSAIPAFVSIDHLGLVSRLIPEWEHVRYHHQRNAYHRFTVDRHLLETAANASTLASRVDRPDLLVIGALLHDIGKGLDGDHTDLGIEIVGSLAPRMGFSAEDTAVLCSLVRCHLLLADTATRRDLSDPVTIETVADQVGDRTTLQLLGALTKADSLATGSSAWSAWKEQLVDELVARTDRYLADRSLPSPEARNTEQHRELAASVRASARPEVVVEPPTVVVAAFDRPGLLADVAGTLALHGLDVYAADAQSVDDVAVDIFSVETRTGRWPSAEDLSRDLAAVLSASMDLDEQLKARARTYAGAVKRWSARPVVPTVEADNGASASSTVIEVRAIDEIGLLHRLTATLFAQGIDVVTARVATIGGEVVDVFYVRTPDGSKITSSDQLDAVIARLRSVLPAPA